MNKLISALFCLLSISISWSQLRVGDPGVTFNESLITANKSCYPQMERWSKAGVIGGIPFLSDYQRTMTIDPGNSDDLNRAIDQMDRRLSGNQRGLIILKNGNYRIGSSVRMKNNIALKGESRDGVKCTIYMSGGAAFLFNDVSYAGLYDMSIEGSWGQPKYNWNYSLGANDELPGNDNISVQMRGNTSNCWLDRVSIINSAQDPLRVNARHNTLRDLYVDGAHKKAGGAQGYFFIQDGDNLITGCYVTHLRHISLQGDGVEYNVVYDNNFEQEVSFHSGDDGFNLIENNRITLPVDMPPVAPGDADATTPREARNGRPIYFAIMGPWSTRHQVSARDNFIINNECLQLNHDFGPNKPWSAPNTVYRGPVRIGRQPDHHINNFPLMRSACRTPNGGTLYPILLESGCEDQGNACDDGDACTINDTYDADCNCSGTAVADDDNDGVCNTEDVCPNLDDSLIGTPCDDGNACTVDDVYTEDCGCAGVAVADDDNDGVCNTEDVCPNLDDSLIGTPCDDGNACTVDDIYTEDCGCEGIAVADDDNDGVCNAEDVCPNLDDSLIGTPCDDGNACTVDDIYTEDCGCAGTTMESEINVDPVADAFIDFGTLRNGSVLRVDEGNRISYIKFDISEIPISKRSNAALKLTVSDDGGEGTVSVYSSKDIGWTENTLSTTNAPKPEMLIGELTRTFNTGQTYFIPITDLDGLATFTMILFHSGSNDIAFLARENNNGPKLIFSGTNPCGEEESDGSEEEEDNQNAENNDESQEDENNDDTDSTEDDSEEDNQDEEGDEEEQGDQQVENAVNMVMYPNPTYDSFTIFSNAKGAVYVFDLNGKRFFSSAIGIGEHKIDISRLPAGTYMVYLVTLEGIRGGKIIKQ